MILRCSMHVIELSRPFQGLQDLLRAKQLFGPEASKVYFFALQSISLPLACVA